MNTTVPQFSSALIFLRGIFLFAHKRKVEESIENENEDPYQCCSITECYLTVLLDNRMLSNSTAR